MEWNLSNGYVQGLESEYVIVAKSDLQIYIAKITVALEGIEYDRGDKPTEID